MTAGPASDSVLQGAGLRKTFRRETGETVNALVEVGLVVHRGSLTALVGPDGAGKTTLMRLAAGLLQPTGGELRVLGVDVTADPLQVQSRLGYMPQRFGLYEDLTVQENLDLYADLHGVSTAERHVRYPQLMEMTQLGRFTRRLAGRLSGGMKQKLGLACTLVRSPELLLLDEPTVGVDPLSRRELWEIILHLVHEQSLTVLLSTSYLDEAERCEQVVVMHRGQVLAQGPPGDVTQLAAEQTFFLEPSPQETARSVQARLLDQPQVIDAVPEGGHVRVVMADRPRGTDGVRKTLGRPAVPVTPRFEDGFMVLLRGAVQPQATPDFSPPSSALVTPDREEVIVEVRDLVKQFGKFRAVDHVNFTVRRGEIFGLLGPNGAGKTTTFRMLCGLLVATGGHLRIAGVDVLKARASARERIGYVAQKFSLYGQLTVRENLEFFASAYGLRGTRRRQRIEWALAEFGLAPVAGLPSGQLPEGFKRRLAMGTALLHEPDILFLDEPTSGADPLARRDFWRRITSLAEQGVTVIITTHFMEEAEYCDHIAILDAGRVLAQGTAAEVRSLARPVENRASTMEDAFIAIVESARDAGENN